MGGPRRLTAPSRWLFAEGTDRVFLTLSSSGEYRLIREQDRADRMVAVATEMGTFTAAGNKLVLTPRSRKPSVCPEWLPSVFGTMVYQGRLHLWGTGRALTLNSLPLEGGEATGARERAIHGCFRGNTFTPDPAVYPTLVAAPAARPASGKTRSAAPARSNAAVLFLNEQARENLRDMDRKAEERRLDARKEDAERSYQLKRDEAQYQQRRYEQQRDDARYEQRREERRYEERRRDD